VRAPAPGLRRPCRVLVRRQDRSAKEDADLTVLKQQMADRLLASPASEVYDVDGAP
jgi:hypothetical protein